MFEQLGLIGCGLMGGSFALALKRAGLVKRVVGYSKSPSTTARALQMGVIDVEAPSALLAVSGADLVLLAVPVAATEATLKAIRHLVSTDMLIMDVGSSKRDVVDAARRVLKQDVGVFVPCHPITGREVSGVENADAALYAGKQVIITPIERTLTAKLEQATALWRALGCEVVNMSPESHDAAYAAVSHLPHLVAFALMNSIVAQPEGREYLSLAGPGFRDFSRIAASDPQMWRDVLIANREELARQTGLFQQALDDLQRLIANGQADDLERLINRASHARANWRVSKGAPPFTTCWTPTTRASCCRRCASSAAASRRKAHHTSSKAWAGGRVSRGPSCSWAMPARRCARSPRPSPCWAATTGSAASRACTSARSATWSMPCARWVATSTTSASPAIRRCTSARPARGLRSPSRCGATYPASSSPRC